jgi:WD40 repeat protein
MHKGSHQRRFASKLTFGDSDSEVFVCRYDPTDKYVACGFGDGAIRIYDSKKGKCAFTLCSSINFDGKSEDMPITDIRWRPTNQTMKSSNVLTASTADGWLRHWHVPSGKCYHSYRSEDGNDQQIYSIDYNNDGSFLATVGKDKMVRLYDE